MSELSHPLQVGDRLLAINGKLIQAPKKEKEGRPSARATIVPLSPP
jgi:hypothetical protein